MGYEIFDDIVCISLEGNTDRQNRVTKVFESLNIHPRFSIAKKNPRGGRVGCFESHIDVIQEAYNKGSQTVLIFEDDVILTPGYNETLLNVATTFMQKNTQWEIFQLGWGVNGIEKTPVYLLKLLTMPQIDSNIYKFCAILTHAYAISRKGMEAVLLSYTKDNITTMPDETYPHYDEYLTKIINNGYCIAPILFDQEWCQPSNNTPKTPFEKILRQFICTVEATKYIHYLISLIIVYRIQIIFLVLVTTFSVSFWKQP
jgi:GR25 family glycosyltransferase involved in LPS biosynthesis